MNYSYTDNWRIKKIERVEVQTLFLHHLPELSKAQPPITIRIKFYKCLKGNKLSFSDSRTTSPYLSGPWSSSWPACSSPPWSHSRPCPCCKAWTPSQPCPPCLVREALWGFLWKYFLTSPFFYITPLLLGWLIRLLLICILCPEACTASASVSKKAALTSAGVQEMSAASR